MKKRLSSLATLVDGELIGGDGDLVCEGAFPLGEKTVGHVTMLDDLRRVSELNESQAIAVVCSERLESTSMAQIVVADPRQAFTKIVACFRPPVSLDLPSWGIDPSATLAESARIHPSAIIGAGVKIGERSRIMPGVVVLPHCQIGDDCIVHANVTLYEHTQIADRVTIHAGTIIGANGFGYRQVAGRHVPTAQLGNVQIDSDVEIGASVTIDRGTYGTTLIGEGTKIDNQVMIAHNCKIGRHNLICSQVGIAGSCTTGDYVILAGQVGLKDHISLGDQTIVGAQAGVMDDCEGHQVYLGSPATPQREQMQIMAVERRLPEMRRELKNLRRDIDRLIQQSQQTGYATMPSEPISIESCSKRAA
ncbi:UDP-3-O-acylglucosamine N-acyltransferase [Novipirellula galeiformis]|uniref:UDP-3-O-acylglucosamine N-acyltransferase n=1 Tax=Novipirellula galeiformis TaxID=2528004 RepID=A0A5C6CHD9_9BACT|nr:UDP-3-O-(3-hydroxymyristoyl)glucosamine N-acyltransferase [Novipirellula galeiformis]TWU23167.1 UDP-3-O-acylglucosamine N-acyltransferase [Novipirellula galeiformis]